MTTAAAISTADALRALADHIDTHQLTGDVYVHGPGSFVPDAVLCLQVPDGDPALWLASLSDVTEVDRRQVSESTQVRYRGVIRRDPANVRTPVVVEFAVVLP